MSSSLRDSVVRITSGNPDESSFGTGFVIYRDEQTTYVLTCAHVVNDVGGPEAVKAGGAAASVVAPGLKDNVEPAVLSEDGVDLAVLRVVGLQNKPLLYVSDTGETGKEFTTAGFQQHYKNKSFLIRSLRGILGEQVGVEAKDLFERTEAWDLEITGKYQLKPGYSGSPVVDASGRVIGVVSTREGGERGVAIAVKALKRIWPDMPTSLLQGAVLTTIPNSKNEVGSTQGEVQTQGSTVELLTQVERKELINLLCMLPNIEYANVRHSLVSTLPAKFQSNIAFDKPPKVHITEIFDLVISDAWFQLPDGSYPIMVLIENAINIVKRSKLGDKVQALLKTLQSLRGTLKGRLGVVLQINTATTSLDRFIPYLDNFIFQMPALQYELQSISNSFNDYDLQSDCATLSAHLTEVYAPFLGFANLLKQSNDLKIISHRFWLMNALLDFNTQAKVVENNIDRFCEMYETVLDKDLPVEEWQRIQNQLDNLMEFCSSVLEAAEKLCKGLR